jgi:sigma-B regulation protein RsbU (phosphoserine phosphatase)
VSRRTRPPHENQPVHEGLLHTHLRDLEAARQVQEHLFPRELPRVPGWDCAAVCRPARVVAGDYHDLFAAAPGRLAVALGDVAGKGLGPALVMAGLHALVRGRLPRQADDLAGLMDGLNRYLLAATPPDLFLTLFLAVLDVGTGGLRYANAGHPAPLLVPGPDEEPVRLAQGGTVLGILPGARYREGHATLAPGSVLTVFSDGLTDTAGADRGTPSERRVVEALWAGHPSAAATLTRVLESFGHLAGGPEPADDVSLLVLRRQAYCPPGGNRT